MPYLHRLRPDEIFCDSRYHAASLSIAKSDIYFFLFTKTDEKTDLPDKEKNAAACYAGTVGRRADRFKIFMQDGFGHPRKQDRLMPHLFEQDGL